MIKLPQPNPIYINEHEAGGIDLTEESHGRPAGMRMAGSYINFYIGNSVVVFPQLDPTYDDDVKTILEQQFPSRRIIGIAAKEILLGGGNIHCMTQQLPTRRVSPT